MALVKRKLRKKLVKQLTTLVKRHGPEMATALVTGVITGLADTYPKKGARKSKVPVKTIVIRKRAVAPSLR